MMKEETIAGWMLYLLSDALDIEIAQAKDEGKSVNDSIIEKAMLIKEIKEPLKRISESNKLYDEIDELPVSSQFKYKEPSELNEIKRARNGYGEFLKRDLCKKSVEDKILAAWQGRCIGCLLGKPIETWTRDKIISFAKDTGNYPIRTYFSSDVSDKIRREYDIVDSYGELTFYGSNVCAWINNVNCMPTDDDTNYTVLGLKILEEYKDNFSSIKVAKGWINNLPALHCMTAERIGYKNILDGIMPPLSGRTRNPYKEYIGAQIRADIYGYINPGNPERAAEMAWEDAVVAQDKNGVYGSMYVASMLSWAYVCDNELEIIRAGLSQIPSTSRLYEGIVKVMEWYNKGVDVQQVMDNIHMQWDERNMYNWCHVIPNAMIVTFAILYCNKEFSTAISLAVEVGFDTDCNAATVGSIMGILLGTRGIDSHWSIPLNNKIKSSVVGFEECEITELAKRTVNIIY